MESITLISNLEEKAELNEDNKENLLFYQSNGSLILESSVNSYLKKVAKEIGLSYWKEFSSHRHTFATRCIEVGISLPVLQTLMEHHDIQTTINEYGKVFNFYQQKEKEKYINYVTAGIVVRFESPKGTSSLRSPRHLAFAVISAY